SRMFWHNRRVAVRRLWIDSNEPLPSDRTGKPPLQVEVDLCADRQRRWFLPYCDTLPKSYLLSGYRIHNLTQATAQDRHNRLCGTVLRAKELHHAFSNLQR